MREFFSYVCGQVNVWAVGGELLPFCQRCTGLYVGGLYAMTLVLLFRPAPKPRWILLHLMLLVQMIPFGYHLVPQGPALRTVTGQLFALGLAFFLCLTPMGRLKITRSVSLLRYGLAATCATPLLLLAIHWGNATVARVLAVLGFLGLSGYALLSIANLALLPSLVWRLLPKRNLAILHMFAALILFCSQTASSQTAPSWQPVSKEELELKDNSMDPGATAMVLYKEVQTDNAKSLETHYTRIKIFKPEGKKYADVEIPYLENQTEIRDIQARTVATDGQVTPFGGEVFDKVVVKTRRYRVNVKAFTMPNVQVGCILEYSYSLHWHGGIPDVVKHPEEYILSGAIAYPAADWAVQGELFVRRAHFILRPFAPRHPNIEIRSIRLPNGTAPKQQPDGALQMDLENIPGIHDEEHSPPEEALRGELYLFYAIGYYSNDFYWTDLGRREFQEMEKFLSKSELIRKEAARLVRANDSPETKLRKLYERVQQIRFISFEPAKTEKEQKQENLKPNKNVEEVLTRGYAFANEVNLLFVALAREAGFTAYPVRVASRSSHFFLKSVPDPSQLNAQVVEVRLGAKNIYLDPATLHCPFGLLPWEELGTSGIRLDQYPGGLVQTPPPDSSDAIIERRGNFLVDKDGNLQGKIDVSFRGQEALERQLQEHGKDEPARKKDLEEEARSWLPRGATVKLTSAAGWEGSSGLLNAAFEVEVPGFATQAGDRLLFPIAILQPRAEKPFQASHRDNAVYFHYGHQERDELTLQAPRGYKVESLPVTRGMNSPAYLYELSTEEKAGALRLTRSFAMNFFYFPPAQYPQIRDFYNFVRTNDDEQAILHAPSAN